jgi:NAD(P)-dependent dehydrogenase (short-subunit alcohol dehydrogenase family)
VRTIVVSGSASGLGAAVCRRLRAGGDDVLGVDLHDADIAADLSTVDGRASAIDAVRARVTRLDGVVVCAGLGPHVEPRRRLVAVNYFGAIGMLDDLLPLLAEGDQSSAVAIASNSIGLIRAEGTSVVDLMLDGDEERALEEADRVDGAMLYGLTKQALARAIRHRAPEWGAQGVRLNAVAPGPVQTPLLQGSIDHPVLGPLVDALPVPLGRRAEPEEIAGIVCFLTSADSAYVHGAVWFADGGTDAQVRPDHF